MMTRTATMVLLLLAVAAACTQEATVDRPLDDNEILTLTQRLTADGAHEADAKAFTSWLTTRTFPVRFRTLDANGNVVDEYVAHSPDDITDRVRQRREARRRAAGRTPEEEAARRAEIAREIEERFPGLRERIGNR